jgi:hypothetical protein
MVSEVKFRLGHNELTLCVNALCELKDLVVKFGRKSYRLRWARGILHANGTPVTQDGKVLERLGTPVQVQWRAP